MENQKARDYLGDVGVGGRTVSKCILNKCIVRMWAEFI